MSNVTQNVVHLDRVAAALAELGAARANKTKKDFVSQLIRDAIAEELAKKASRR